MAAFVKRASCAVAIGALAVAGPAAAEPRVGAVTQQDFLGAIGTRTNGEVRDLMFKENVFSDEVVNTGQTATTSLMFLDETNLFIGSNSRVILDKFVYDPNQQVGEAAVAFGKGAFRWVSGHMRNKEAITLRTPTTVMSIRGTELVIFVLDDGTSEVNVLSGAVDVQVCGVGAPVSLTAGQKVTVTATCNATAAPARAIPAGFTIPVMPDDVILPPELQPAAGPGPQSDGDAADGSDDPGSSSDADRPDNSNNGDNHGGRSHDGKGPGRDSGSGSSGGSSAGGGSGSGGGSSSGGSSSGGSSSGGSTSGGTTSGGTSSGGTTSGGTTSGGATSGGTSSGGTSGGNPDPTGGCGGNCY